MSIFSFWHTLICVSAPPTSIICVAVKALADKKFPEGSIRPDSLLHRAAVKSTSYTSNYSFDESPNITIMSNNTDLTADLPMFQQRENYLE